jgi:hypothetical protein
VAQPQLLQCTTSFISIFEPKLNAVILIANKKNIWYVIIAMLNGLTDIRHLLVAQLLAIHQYVVCEDRSKVAPCSDL